MRLFLNTNTLDYDKETKTFSQERHALRGVKIFDGKCLGSLS